MTRRPITITDDLWYVSVSVKDEEAQWVPAKAVDTMRVLIAQGCKAIDPVDGGSAQCRVPVSWAASARRSGFRSHPAVRGQIFRIDMDMP